MKLVSTTLTGNSEGIIRDALASVVDWVDVCLVIDTGVTDGSLGVARDVAGEKYVERTFRWVNDFSAARNFALEAAHEVGGDWAVTVDTDERLQQNGEDVRGMLARSSVECFLVADGAGAYMKERFFRLPAKLRFTGPTHETYPAHQSSAWMEKLRFVELTKTPEQYRAKFERDVGTLTEHARKNPTDPRWFYYLGDALQHLGRHAEAIRAYEQCAALRGWNEESAWACYRAAECWLVLKRFQDAVDACVAGLARHAGVAELAWLAGYASYEAGDPQQTVWWARLAITMGLYRGRGTEVKRIGFRHAPALYEGPYDLLRFALKDVGDARGAREAERLFKDALRVRTSAGAPRARKRAARSRTS